MWEERLSAEGLNYANNNGVRHQCFDFLCCKLKGEELSCKEPTIWECFRSLHLAIKNEDLRDYFMRKYKDL
jgi:hypothetical protein